MAKINKRQAKIANRKFALSARQVERAMSGVLPEPITSHFVVVGGHRYPPKQVIGAVTGLDRARFTSHHALRLLTRLGFAVGRQVPTRAVQPHAVVPAERPTGAAAEKPLAERLLGLRGQWVAIKGTDVLVAAATPREVVSWLAEHQRSADTMFRVPEDELAATGLAPL